MRSAGERAAANLDDLHSNYALDIGKRALYFWEWLSAGLATRNRSRTTAIHARRERWASAVGSARRALPLGGWGEQRRRQGAATFE
jgi:hypothetical protein